MTLCPLPTGMCTDIHAQWKEYWLRYHSHFLPPPPPPRRPNLAYNGPATSTELFWWALVGLGCFSFSGTHFPTTIVSCTMLDNRAFSGSDSLFRHTKVNLDLKWQRLQYFAIGTAAC